MALAKFLKTRFNLIFLIVLFFIFTRVVVMLCSEILIRQGEEPYVGTIALGIIEGWAIPPWDFQATSYFGGPIVAAVLALPFFILFGSKIIALLSTSIFLHCLGLIFTFLLVEKYFNRRAAILSCIFYTLSPPLFMVRSLIINGAHTEAATFNIFLFFIFLNIIYSNASIINFILLGFFSGISVWYSYLNIITIITYQFIWFIKDRIFFLRKKYFLYLLSFILGFIPWYLYNSKNSFDGFEIINRQIFNLKSIKLTKLASDCLFFIKDSHKIFIFNNFSVIFGNYLNVIYYIFFILSLVYLLFFGLRSFIHSYKKKLHDNSYIKYFLIALLPCFYLFIYILSDRKYEQAGRGITDYRYSVMLFPCIFISIALLIDKLLSLRNVFLKYTGGILLTTVIIMGIIGNGRLIYSLDFRNNYLNNSAVHYDLVGKVAAKRYGLDLARASILINKIRVKNGIRYAYEGYGRSLSAKPLGLDDFNRYIELTKTINMPVDIGRSFWKGVGKGIIHDFMKKNSGQKNINIEQLILKCNKLEIDEAYRDFLYEGIIFELINWHDRPFNFKEVEIDNLAISIPQKYRYLIYIFYGFQVGELSAGKIYYNNSFDISHKLVFDDLKYYYIGMGCGVTHFFSADIKKSINFLNKYDDSVRDYLLIGVGLYSYYLDNSKENLSPIAFPDRYKIYYKKAADLFKNSPILSAVAIE